MIITIQRDALSLFSQYEISTPGCIYTARKKFLSLSDKIILMGPRDRVLARIRSRLPIIGSSYNFELADGTIFRFWCEKFWKGVFACESQSERYRLYQHKGLNYSVFQDDRQIAAFSQNPLRIGAGNQYEIRMNDDANLIVVVCMSLMVESSDDKSGTVTYDVGNIGPEERPFDRSWEPE